MIPASHWPLVYGLNHNLDWLSIFKSLDPIIPHTLQNPAIQIRIHWDKVQFSTRAIDGPARSPARTQSAQSLQRAALAGTRGSTLADAAQQSATLGGGLPAKPALGGCGLLRGDGVGPAFQHPRGAGTPGPAVVMDGRILQTSFVESERHTPGFNLPYYG